MTSVGAMRQTRLARPSRRPLGEPARYSRFVGLMKFGLPALAAALVGAVLAWPGTNDDPREFRLSYAAIDLSNPGRPGMLNARYVGTDEANRPFVVTAESAIVDPADKNRVHLTTLQADMTLDDESWVTVIADRGEYDLDEQELLLSDRVDLFSDHGYEFHAKEVRVHLDSGAATSDLPVQGQGPLGTLRADRFRMTDLGQRLRFEGDVRMVVRPSGGADSAGDSDHSAGP